MNKLFVSFLHYYYFIHYYFLNHSGEFYCFYSKANHIRSFNENVSSDCKIWDPDTWWNSSVTPESLQTLPSLLRHNQTQRIQGYKGAGVRRKSLQKVQTSTNSYLITFVILLSTSHLYFRNSTPSLLLLLWFSED